MTVLATHDGAVWAGFNCGGLTRFDGQRFRTYNEKNGLLNGCVWSLAEDANPDLWIGTYGGGVFRLHDGRFTQYSEAQGFGSNQVFSILSARDGSVWFATRAGLSRIADGRIRNYTTADGLSDSTVHTLYQDRTGGIWVGTFKGADPLTGDRFVNILSFPKTGAFPIGLERSGTLYFDAGSGGILRIENNQPVYAVPGFAAGEMRQTEQGDLWFFGAPILRAPLSILHRLHEPDEPLDYVAFGPADGLKGKEASAGQPLSTVTPDGKFWMATTQGLAMLDLPRAGDHGRPQPTTSRSRNWCFRRARITSSCSSMPSSSRPRKRFVCSTGWTAWTRNGLTLRFPLTPFTPKCHRGNTRFIFGHATVKGFGTELLLFAPA